MTQTIVTKAGAEELTDRVEMGLEDILKLESLLWTEIRQAANIDQVRFRDLHLMGALHRSARRLQEKINQAGKGG